MPAGTFRRVHCLGRVAVKIPRFRHLLAGMRCNRWEQEMWRIWRKEFGWENLCPVKFTGPWGIALVMARAEQPVTADEIESSDTDDYPDIDVEYKAENWGRLDGRIVAVDYGLWSAAAVCERRKYLTKLAAGQPASP